MSRLNILKDSYNEKRIFGYRVSFAVLLIVGMCFLLIWRYFSLQVLEHEIYSTQSERNRVQLQPIPPKRGLIYDRNGVLLAENVPIYTLTVIKERVTDLPQTLVLIRSLIGLDTEDIEKFEQNLKRRRPYDAVPIKFKLDEKEIAIIAANRFRLPGVEVGAQLVRHYPKGELFAHALGYVGRINEAEQFEIDPVNYAGTDEIGKIGIEKRYERQLHGQVGYQNVETNARGRVLRVLERTDPVPGNDLILNLDARLQQVAFDALAGERGAVVAIDPRTGGVLALVSTPSFDANLFVTGISSKEYAELRDSIDLPLFNRALQGQYPPGSTMKPFYGLAGLHNEVITPESVVYDPGWYRLPNDERFYRDWKRGGHATWVNLDMAIVQSCDVFFYDLAYKLGIDRIHDFTAPFGFGDTTGIDTTNERSGLLPSREWKQRMKRLPWFPGETLNIGIGQGYMLTTPVQLAYATAIMAAHGKRHVPRLVQSVGGDTVAGKPLPPIDGVAENQWQVITGSMRNVVHGARGTANRISHGATYQMAGKTGTAQVIGIAQGEEYDAEQVVKRQRDHALFIGFAPFDDPQIAVAVVVENGEHGSSTAAPIARKLFDAQLLTSATETLEAAQYAMGDQR